MGRNQPSALSRMPKNLTSSAGVSAIESAGRESPNVEGHAARRCQPACPELRTSRVTLVATRLKLAVGQPSCRKVGVVDKDIHGRTKSRVGHDELVLHPVKAAGGRESRGGNRHILGIATECDQMLQLFWPPEAR